MFGTINGAVEFRRFSLRGITKVAIEGTLVTLAYNCRRTTNLMATP